MERFLWTLLGFIIISFMAIIYWVNAWVSRTLLPGPGVPGVRSRPLYLLTNKSFLKLCWWWYQLNNSWWCQQGNLRWCLTPLIAKKCIQSLKRIFRIFFYFFQFLLYGDLSKTQWIRKWKWHFSLRWSWKWKIPNTRYPLQQQMHSAFNREAMGVVWMR